MAIPKTLDEAIDFLFVHPDDAEWQPKLDVIPLDYVRLWMKTSDIEFLGFTHGIVNDGRFRIHPRLEVSEYVAFAKHYFERCLRENPDGDWSDSSYSAGWDLCRLFVHLWDCGEGAVTRSILLDIKMWLANLYRHSDAKLRLCIVHATLEHLFEREPIMKFFLDWREDPVLRPAFEEAALWPLHGGKTHLSE